MSTYLHPDIARAAASVGLGIGCRRELRVLDGMIAPHDQVAAMIPCRHQGGYGLAVVTGSRLLFVCNGYIWKISQDIDLGRISFVEARSVLGLGTMTVHVGGTSLQFTGLTGTGGAVFLQELRRLVAEHAAGTQPRPPASPDASEPEAWEPALPGSPADLLVPHA